MIERIATAVIRCVRHGLQAMLAAAAIMVPAHAQAAPPVCAQQAYAGATYIVCTIDLATYALRLHWKDEGGVPYGNVGTLARALNRAGVPVVMAVNAGMYHADGAPVGLYIEGGEQLKKANTAGGPGNFHMKPNGVFYFTDDEAGVMETSRFLKSKPRANYATQSGPMLVIDGRIHPRFSVNGPSLKIRNGVGVRDPHTVIFAISNGAVSFGDFARLFRDILKCQNALFLDGSISSLWAPSVGHTGEFWPAGPIVSARPRRQ